MERLLHMLLVSCLLVACGSDAQHDLSRALTGRGAVAVLGADDLLELRPDAAKLVSAATLPGVRAALEAGDTEALSRELARAGMQGVLVDARPQALSVPAGSVARKLATYAALDGFSGAYLSPLASLYVLDPTHSWSPELRAGLAEVARRLVAGQAPPRLTSFPESVRRVDPVEVMVLLRAGDKPRLWRSARGSSFARALVTAASVARKRWNEREQAMGGPLDAALASLSVEVSLLADDGELGDRDAHFVDRAIGKTHGVAYERKGVWRYYLPEATHKSRRPSEAYAKLFAEDGLPQDSLRSVDLRPYRLAVKRVSVSAPSTGAETSR